MTDSTQTRVLFVNSGILGHRAVAALLEDAAQLMPSVAAEHLNLSDNLTYADRALRWVLSRRVAPDSGPLGNLDLGRWRMELNIGLLASRRVRAAERSGRFDVLHYHPQPTAYASLSRMTHGPAIVSIDATQQLASEEARPGLHRSTYLPNIVHDGLVFRRAAAIVAASAWAARSLTVNYADCAEKVHVLPYPVRSCVDVAWVDERYARARRNGSPVRALFMGGDFPRKGGFELLDAWRAAAFGKRAELTLVTDWPIDQSRLPPGVRHVRGVNSYSSSWSDLWREADLFVMPARHEAFGMVYQEAAAAGLPVVATNVNAVPEIVEDGRTGALVATDDGRALVGALSALVESADLRRRMGGAALARIRVDGAPARYAARLESIIQSVAKTHVH